MNVKALIDQISAISNHYNSTLHDDGLRLKTFGMESMDIGDPALILSFNTECYIYFQQCLQNRCNHKSEILDKMCYILQYYNSGMSLDAAECYSAACMRILTQFLI